MEPYVITAVAFVIKAALWGGLALWGLAIGREVFDAYRDPEDAAIDRAWARRVRILLFVIAAAALTTASQREHGYRPQTRIDGSPGGAEQSRESADERSEEAIEIPPADGDREERRMMSDDAFNRNDQENRESVEEFQSLPAAKGEE